MRVYISPSFRGEDKGDGGIRRVVEAQYKWLPKYDIEVVERPEEGELLALHAGNWADTIPAGVPMVAHCHGLYWEGYAWARWAVELNKDVIRTLKQADAVTAPSHWVARALARGAWLRPHVMYHGIEPDDWPEPSGEHEGYVLWNKTRVDAVCDPAPVVELAKRAASTQFETTFVPNDVQVPVNLRVTGSQRYTTACDRVRRAGVYLCTARETFGIGTLEAMAAGVPILGWNWGGQAEFIRHKTHGWLAEPGDYDGLVEGLEYCLANRDRLGKAARDDVLADFTWEKRIKPYAELYRLLAEQWRDSKKVSVVITNYNLGQYLPKAVQSVIQQTTYPNDTEIIIVDDASTEPLPDEITALTAEDNPNSLSVEIIRNGSNQYLAEALNVGVKAARGRYIVPLDADNELAPNALDIMVDALDKDRSLDIAYGKINFVRENENFVSTWPPPEAELDEQLKHRNQISSTSMYRRRVWERVGGYRRRCHTAEDADFWIRALSVGFSGRRVTDAVTLIYNDRDASMSHTQQDWAWHDWYSYAREEVTRLWAAGGKYIPTCEFPAVSVIIPVGPGHERMVLDALDSLQNQSFRYWEAIVVNDTGGVIPWLHPWALELHGKRTGVSEARNAGLDHARAPFVMFLDADDYLHPDALHFMYTAIKQEGGFVYSDWFKGESGEVYQCDDWEIGRVMNKMQASVVCLYKKDDLDRAKVRFDPAFKQGWEDWDFAMQAELVAGLRGTHVRAPLFHYRMNTGGLREDGFANHEQIIKQMRDKWRDYYDGNKENYAMAGCCGGGRPFLGVSVYSGNGEMQMAPTTQADANSGADMVVLEYTGKDEGRSFLGPVTGNRYRFDNGELRKRRVFAQDAPGLLEKGWFKKVVEMAPNSTEGVTFEPLVAKGPPAKAASKK